MHRRRSDLVEANCTTLFTARWNAIHGMSLYWAETSTRFKAITPSRTGRASNDAINHSRKEAVIMEIIVMFQFAVILKLIDLLKNR
jgi:hypothetical protein